MNSVHYNERCSFMIPITHRDRQRAQLRREILETASAAFDIQGYEQFSMRRLAAQLGCSPGTLYLYFRDKDELLHAVIEESFAGLLETLRSIPTEGDPLSSMKQKLRAYIDFGLRNPHQYKCAFVLRSSRRSKRPYQPHPAFDEMLHAVRECAELGVLGRADITITSQVLWACIHGITSLLVARPAFPWTEKNQLIEELIEAAVAGVARNRRLTKGGIRNGSARSGKDARR